MKFLHTADVHLGAEPDAGSAYTPKRKKEIWNSFQKLLETCEHKKIDLLLIAGDLFHRQPLLRELKELGYLFGKLTHTHVVMIAGNHDYLKKGSYYRTFQWPENVHMLLSGDVAKVELPQFDTAVSGFSYHSREVRGGEYVIPEASHRQRYEILLLHGGDEAHAPFQKKDILRLGYDYIALGHIHKPHTVVPGRMAYCGALEPVDKNDMGRHGYIVGEITEEGCKIMFVPSALREYRQIEVETTAEMTNYELREKVQGMIEDEGTRHMYKIMLNGFRDPDMVFDLRQLDMYGNVVEAVDDTKPAYDFESLKVQNEGNILGRFIKELEDCGQSGIEYRAMCEGIQALMETRRG